MSLFVELRRRNVVKVAVAYAIVGWILVEVSSVMGPALNLPDWATSLVAFFLILGFPVALLLSWAYELTPDGMTRTKSVPLSESITHITGRKLDFVIIGVLAIAVAFFALERFLVDEAPETEIVADESVEPSQPVAAENQREVLPNSVAVLPFDNLSPNPDEAYFAVGLHDEILSQLAKLSNLSVISRTSMMRYADSDLSIPEIARELNVGTVMEGSVRYADDRVRITTQLIDAETDEHLWAETYEREFSDIFAIESDIAMNIANALEAEFSLEEQENIEKIPTRSVAAYELYLQATASIFDGRIAVETAHTLLDRAIELDTEFALAYDRKASLFNPGAEEIIEYAQEALSHDPNLPSAQVRLGQIDVQNWRWSEGRERIERASELAPNSPSILLQYAWINAIDGRHDEAMRDTQRALALNSSGGHLLASYVYLYAGRDDEALRILREGIAQNPTSFLVLTWLSRLEMFRGNRSEAEKLAMAAEEYYPAGGAGPHYVAYGLALAGLQDEAVRFSNNNPAPGIGLGGGQIMRSLVRGDQQRALGILDQIVETRFEYGPGLLTLVENLWRDPVLDQSEFVAARTRFRQALLE